MKSFFSKIFQLLFVTWGVTLITFALGRLIPTDPAASRGGDLASVETIEKLRVEMGLDKPAIVQYLYYLRDLLSGDLGTSIYSGRPVANEIGRYFTATMELTMTTLILATFLGVSMGVAAAKSPNSIVDKAVRQFSMIGTAIPIFWLGLILAIIFYGFLDWLPGTGRFTLDLNQPDPITGSLIVDSLIQFRFANFLDALKYIALPTLTLAIPTAAILSSVTRTAILEITHENYFMAALARGIPLRRVFYIHALRNALSPVLNVFGVIFGGLLGGAVITETIFLWPGIGYYAVQSMFRNDLDVLMAVVILVSISVSLINILIDYLSQMLNPITRRKV